MSTIIPVGGLLMGGQKFGLSGFSRPDITPDGTKITWRAESLEGTEDGGEALSSLTGTGSRPAQPIGAAAEPVSHATPG